MSFVYEVNLEIDANREEEFAGWLKPHIEEMLSFHGFRDARWFSRECKDESNTENVVLWTIQYTLVDRGAYEAYLKMHASRMRNEGTQKFSSHFQASRRLLTTRNHFYSSPS
jgi:hypothetical protein